MSGALSSVCALRVCAVLRDCLDQLAVLGHITSGPHRDASAAAAAVAMKLQQRSAEAHQNVAGGGEVQGGGVSVQELHRTQGQRELERELMNTNVFTEDMDKVQSDRRFISKLITELMTELKEQGTFYSLSHTVAEEKRTKAEMQQTIISEKESRLRIRTLQEHILDINKETTLQIQERDKMEAHIEDQLQEWKMKKTMEEKFVNKSTQLLISQGQKLNSHMEKELEDEIEMLKTKLMEEERFHKELVLFLENTKTSLEEKLEDWNTRYDKDTADKQQELNTLKTNVSNNRAQLQDLATKYRDSEQVIIKDRLEKENLRKQLEKQQLQRKAAIKGSHTCAERASAVAGFYYNQAEASRVTESQEQLIKQVESGVSPARLEQKPALTAALSEQIQSWWRGTLVRYGLGPFKKEKKPKQKKKSNKAKKK